MNTFIIMYVLLLHLFNFLLFRPDVSTVFVSIGFGFFLELTRAEACNFITKKVDQISKRVKALEEEAFHINADIKMMLTTLGQLQGLIPDNV
jgi:prefoldin subunit 5